MSTELERQRDSLQLRILELDRELREAIKKRNAVEDRILAERVDLMQKTKDRQ
jgi:hypothetical protein